MEHIYALIKSAQRGDADAKEALIQENSGLIWSIARRFHGRAEPEDLYQVGAIGLLKCIEKFDISYGVKFSTYAVPMIMGEIRCYLRDDGMIKVSRNLKELSYQARKMQETVLKNENVELSIPQLAERLSVSAEDLLLAMESSKEVASIHAGKYNETNEKNIIEFIADNTENEKMMEQIILKEAMHHLEKKERQLIILRYYQDKTQNEAADKMGISQVQVSRLEKKVLKKLRMYL